MRQGGLIALPATLIIPKNLESAAKYLFVLPAFRVTMARRSRLNLFKEPFL
jgi:hypothetical protein